MKRIYWLPLSLVFFVVALYSLLVVRPSSADAVDQSQAVARTMSHVLDYLAKDYSEAVSETGKVVNPSEFQEQVDFAKQLNAQAPTLKPWANHAQFVSEIQNLGKLIEKKSAPSAVLKKARELQSELLRNASLSLTPTTTPHLALGEKIFKAQCTQCHGEQGRGDGVLAAQLDPKPINFHDSERMKLNSPFQIYNTLRLGIEGTSMPAYPQLKDDEVWSLAFYISQVRISAQTQSDAPPVEPKALVGALAQHSDAELLAQNAGWTESKLAWARKSYETLLSSDSSDFFQVLTQKIQESRTLTEAAQFSEAKSALLAAYLEGFEPVEPSLKARQPQFIAEMETHFAHARKGIESKNTQLALESFSEIESTSEKIQSFLAENKTSFGLTVVSVFTILFREGFEAFLIVWVMINILNQFGAAQAKKWVHAGWVSALLIGLVLWNVSDWVVGVSGLGREAIEGIASLFAVVILVYVGFWLHRHAVAKEWQKMIRQKLNALLETQNLIGMSVLAFIAVFREVLETVVFLRAAAPTPETSTAMYVGVALSAAALTVCFWVLTKSSKQLPIQRIFALSSYLIVALSVVLVGQGLHALQECGWVGMHTLPTPWLKFELLGLYPTVETFGAQVLLLGALLLFLKNQSQQKKLVPSAKT